MSKNNFTYLGKLFCNLLLKFIWLPFGLIFFAIPILILFTKKPNHTRMVRQTIIKIFALFLLISSLIATLILAKYKLNNDHNSLISTTIIGIFLGSHSAWIKYSAESWIKGDPEKIDFMLLIPWFVHVLVVIPCASIIMFGEWLNKFEWFRNYIGEIQVSPAMFFIFITSNWITNLGLTFWKPTPESSQIK